MQTGTITGRGQIVGTTTNPALSFGITVGSSIVEMKLSIGIGSEPGKIQCSDPAQALSERRGYNKSDTQSSHPVEINSKIIKQAYSDEHSRSSKSSNNQPNMDAISLRQRALEVIISVTPANIGSLIDPFRNLNNNPGGLSGMGGGRGNGGGPASSSKTAGTGSGSAMASSNSDPYGLKGIINANTLTAVVVGAVTAAVGNTVAASSASSSASMSNAFQMIGHAQCEYLFVCVSINLMLHFSVIRTCAGKSL
jgi:hypothetical protein